MSTHNLYFEQKYEKNLNFLSENFHFLVVKFSVYLNRRVFFFNGFIIAQDKDAVFPTRNIDIFHCFSMKIS